MRIPRATCRSLIVKMTISTVWVAVPGVDSDAPMSVVKSIFSRSPGMRLTISIGPLRFFLHRE